MSWFDLDIWLWHWCQVSPRREPSDCSHNYMWNGPWCEESRWTLIIKALKVLTSTSLMGEYLVVNHGRYFNIKQTWSACFFQILIGSNKNILMDKCTFHVSCDRAGYQDRTFWLTDFFIWIREFTYSIRELSNSFKGLSNSNKELSIYV